MRLVTVAGEPEREAALAAELDTQRDVEVVLRCVDRVEVLAAIRGASLDAVVVTGDPSWFDAECGHEAVQRQVTVVALAPDPIAADRLRSMGVRVLTPDASLTDVLLACAQITATDDATPHPEDRGDRGRTIAVWGPKGAPGRSSLAIELAAELAAGEPNTLLVDADTYGGDLLQLLGVTEELPTVVWASRLAAKKELFSERLLTELRRIGDAGPVLLPGIPRAELWPEISDFGWKELLEVIQRTFAYTVVDVGFALEPNVTPYPEAGEGRNRTTRVAMKRADHVVAVVRGDPIGIKNFVWALEQVTELVDPDRILVVVNRVRPGEDHEVADILRRYTHKRPVCLVPDAPELFATAVAVGTSVRAGPGPAEIAAPMSALAAAVGGRVAPRGFLARLGGRR